MWFHSKDDPSCQLWIAREAKNEHIMTNDTIMKQNTKWKILKNRRIKKILKKIKKYVEG